VSRDHLKNKENFLEQKFCCDDSGEGWQRADSGDLKGE
jgi:hypothetical protein